MYTYYFTLSVRVIVYVVECINETKNTQTILVNFYMRVV